MGVHPLDGRASGKGEQSMGFKKLISLVCDGPCGAVLPETEKAPVGWNKVTVTEYERLDIGQKPSKRPLAMWLCPKCSANLLEILKKSHYATQGGDEIEP